MQRQFYVRVDAVEVIARVGGVSGDATDRRLKVLVRIWVVAGRPSVYKMMIYDVEEVNVTGRVEVPVKRDSE